MKKHEVNEIIVPIETNLSIKPSVSAEDKITDAIEIMLKNDLNRIAVTQENRVMGMIRLEDAMKKIGLEGDLKAQRAKIVVRQGRKFIIDGPNE
ncbi:MAG: CBS domain-containing protein [Deltaproteobacteria bacterium]|nr:CBS domain-containing protein [Deltaproteobacteria bacterium]